MEESVNRVMNVGATILTRKLKKTLGALRNHIFCTLNTANLATNGLKLLNSCQVGVKIRLKTTGVVKFETSSFRFKINVDFLIFP